MSHPRITLNWPQPRIFPALAEGDVHIWAVPLGESPDAKEIEKILSSAECMRVESFAFDTPRQVFANSRIALRCLLSRYLDIPPRDVPIVIDSNGKPQLADGGLRFNLAHSGELALVAFTDGGEIGVDVEQVRPVDRLLEIAARNFHPHERETIRAASAADQPTVFHRCWTRKEAVIKAIGIGLKYPLDAFDVLAAAELALPSNEIDATRCWLKDVLPASGYAAAVATTKRRDEVHGFSLAMDWCGDRVSPPK
jgi:4'-phosphopantetheinyl transferase